MTYRPPEGSIPTQVVPTLDGVAALHLIGIGGSGMRNLAKLFLGRGIAISGSDLRASAALEALEAAGATVAVGHSAEHLRSPDAVVASSAIAATNVELTAARERGIPVWSRAQAVAALARGARTVAVSGTHGKTTTTSMISLILERTGHDPSCLIGGEANEIGGGARTGASDLLVVEADESDGSFLLLHPQIGVVTNIEVDHVDFYRGGLSEIEAAFDAFADQCTKLIACTDDPVTMRLAEMHAGRTITYGTAAEAQVRYGVGDLGPDGATGWIEVDGARSEIYLRVDGAHNLADAAAAVAATGLLGVDTAAATAALAEFTGVHRRFERRGRARGVDFFDDYGHVPTELAVTLETARRRAPRRVIALFQPHRYSRTQALWRELGASLSPADLVIVTDVYGADQEPIPGVTGKLVVRGIAEAGGRARIAYLPRRSDVVDYLDAELREGDLIVTMGCGDVWMLGDAARAALGGSA